MSNKEFVKRTPLSHSDDEVGSTGKGPSQLLFAFVRRLHTPEDTEKNEAMRFHWFCPGQNRFIKLSPMATDNRLIQAVNHISAMGRFTGLEFFLLQSGNSCSQCRTIKGLCDGACTSSRCHLIIVEAKLSAINSQVVKLDSKKDVIKQRTSVNLQDMLSKQGRSHQTTPLVSVGPRFRTSKPFLRACLIKAIYWETINT